jgi:hypothetical protein
MVKKTERQEREKKMTERDCIEEDFYYTKFYQFFINIGISSVHGR